MSGLARRGETYAIGALTTYARPEQMREWHDRAGAGDRCIYAIGPALGTDPSAALARRYSEDGTVHLSRERDGRGWRYFMERRPQGAVPAERPVRLHADEARMLSLLADAAARGRRCPSYSDIAEQLDLPTREQARYRFNALVRGGHVRVIASGRASGRVIEIAASGQRTAGVNATFPEGQN